MCSVTKFCQKLALNIKIDDKLLLCDTSSRDKVYDMVDTFRKQCCHGDLFYSLLPPRGVCVIEVRVLGGSTGSNPARLSESHVQPNSNGVTQRNKTTWVFLVIYK